MSAPAGMEARLHQHLCKSIIGDSLRDAALTFHRKNHKKPVPHPIDASLRQSVDSARVGVARALQDYQKRKRFIPMVSPASTPQVGTPDLRWATPSPPLSTRGPSVVSTDRKMERVLDQQRTLLVQSMHKHDIACSRFTTAQRCYQAQKNDPPLSAQEREAVRITTEALLEAHPRTIRTQWAGEAGAVVRIPKTRDGSLTARTPSSADLCRRYAGVGSTVDKLTVLRSHIGKHRASKLPRPRPTATPTRLDEYLTGSQRASPGTTSAKSATPR